jgi:hypothetical protein
MLVFLDIDGTVMVHQRHHGRLVADAGAPPGWGGQVLCRQANQFFDFVCNRHQPHWLTAWVPAGIMTKVRNRLLPVVPAAGPVVPAIWRHDKSEALPEDVPWVWLDDDYDPVLVKEWQWLHGHDVSVARISEDGSSWRWEHLNPWSPRALLVCCPTCLDNLITAMDFLAFFERITDLLEPALRRPPPPTVWNFPINKITIPN